MSTGMATLGEIEEAVEPLGHRVMTTSAF